LNSQEGQEAINLMPYLYYKILYITLTFSTKIKELLFKYGINRK